MAVLRLRYATWEACYNAVRAVLPDMAVGIMDTGEAPVPIGDLGLAKAQVEWIKAAEHLVYIFHHRPFIVQWGNK